MSSNQQRWRINLRNLDTTIAIGIHPHEKTPQRVFISAVIEGNYPAKPQSINDCFDYDPVYDLVTKDWPTRPHVDLLETRVFELLEFIFRLDTRVIYAKASICKPNVFPQAESVGAEAEWTRADFERNSVT